MDIIRLNNMVFYAYHGYYEVEQDRGQRFELDLEMTCNFDAARASGQLNDTVDYHAVYERVKRIFNSSKFTLLENLIEKIAQVVLSEYAVSAVRIRIRKPQVAMDGLLDNVEIEIFREKP